MTPEQETQVETARRVLAAQPTHERTQDEIVWQKWAGVLLAIIDELQKENERLTLVEYQARQFREANEPNMVLGAAVRPHLPVIDESVRRTLGVATTVRYAHAEFKAAKETLALLVQDGDEKLLPCSCGERVRETEGYRYNRDGSLHQCGVKGE